MFSHFSLICLRKSKNSSGWFCIIIKSSTAQILNPLKGKGDYVTKVTLSRVFQFSPFYVTKSKILLARCWVIIRSSSTRTLNTLKCLGNFADKGKIDFCLPLFPHLCREIEINDLLDVAWYFSPVYFMFSLYLKFSTDDRFHEHSQKYLPHIVGWR